MAQFYNSFKKCRFVSVFILKLGTECKNFNVVFSINNCLCPVRLSVCLSIHKFVNSSSDSLIAFKLHMSVEHQ